MLLLLPPIWTNFQRSVIASFSHLIMCCVVLWMSRKLQRKRMRWPHSKTCRPAFRRSKQPGGGWSVRIGACPAFWIRLILFNVYGGGDSQRDGQGYVDEDIQDILRAAVVFTSAGIDACLGALLSHAIPPLVNGMESARKRFEIFIEEQVRAPKVDRIFLGALTSPDPRAQMLNQYIIAQTKSSFQGSLSLKSRALAPLGIRNEQISDLRLKALNPIFEARNEIAHALDLLPPAGPHFMPERNPRNADEVVRMCDEVFSLLSDIIMLTGENIKASSEVDGSSGE